MKKNLKRILIPFVIAGSLALSGCGKTVDNYIIDGNKVEKTKHTTNIKKDFLTEFQKDGDTIKFKYSDQRELRKLYINEKEYSIFASAPYQKVWEAGKERFKYLNNKVDSINQKVNQEKIRKSVNRDLEAIKSN